MAALVGEELLRHSGYEAESSGIWARLLVLPPCCELVHIWAIRAVCPVRNGRMTMALMEGPVTLERREEKKKKKERPDRGGPDGKAPLPLDRARIHTEGVHLRVSRGKTALSRIGGPNGLPRSQGTKVLAR